MGHVSHSPYNEHIWRQTCFSQEFWAFKSDLSKIILLLVEIYWFDWMKYSCFMSQDGLHACLFLPIKLHFVFCFIVANINSGLLTRYRILTLVLKPLVKQELWATRGLLMVIKPMWNQDNAVYSQFMNNISFCVLGGAPHGHCKSFAWI